MSKPQVITLAVAVLIVAAGAAWYFNPPNVDPQVAAIEQMGQQLFANRESMTEEQQRAAFTQMRAAYEQLTPEQRDEARDRRRREWEKRETEQMRKFFALPAAEQVKELDQRIDQMERWRKEREERRRRERANPSANANNGDRGRGGPGGGGPGAGGNGGGDRGGRGDGDGRRGGGGGTGADRNERRQQYLNSTTAEQRAMRTEYRRMMSERRKQRGLG